MLVRRLVWFHPYFLVLCACVILRQRWMVEHSNTSLSEELEGMISLEDVNSLYFMWLNHTKEIYPKSTEPIYHDSRD